MHEADLLNKFSPIGQGLDIIEFASIYSMLPSKYKLNEFIRLSI